MRSRCKTTRPGPDRQTPSARCRSGAPDDHRVSNGTGDWRGRHGRSERCDGSRRTLRSRQGAQRLQARRRYILLDHARLRDLGAADPRRHHPLPDRGRLAGDAGIRLCVPVDAALGAVGRSAGAGRARPDLRHAGDLGHRDAHRRSRSGSASRSSSPSCARNGCAGRSASPSSCSPAFPRSSTACGASSCSARFWPTLSSRS